MRFARLAIASSAALATGLVIDQPQSGQRLWDRQVASTEASESCRPTAPNGKVVFVTGTGGFIGFSTALALKKRGDGVLGLDNFNEYYPSGLKRARNKLLHDAGILTLEADLNDADAIAAAMARCNFTHVLNLAAQAGVRYAIQNPGSYVQSNVAGFVSIIEAVKRQTPMPSVVYASSSSVYGTNTKVPFSEEDPVDHPASLYAATKKENELLAHTYNHINHIAFTGLRFFTVYGPWGRPDMAAFKFANEIEMGKPLSIYQGPGGSELQRDFTYIDDIVAGCVAAIDRIGPSGVVPADLKVYNLGNENPVTVSEMVGIIEEHMGKKAIRDYKPLPATGDVLITHANVSLAHAELGYTPTTSLRDGLKKFVEWYKDYYKAGLDDAMMAYEGIPKPLDAARLGLAEKPRSSQEDGRTVTEELEH